MHLLPGPMLACVLATVMSTVMFLPAPALAGQRTILFVGNSFTHAGPTPVKTFRPDSVTDLNGTGYGGVPALFQSFARQAGFDFSVSLDTHGGKSLRHHLENCRDQLSRHWDVVVLQELSMLDRRQPGDPDSFRAGAHGLAELFTAANPAVEVHLMATWSRADLTYRSTSPWQGEPVTEMAEDLHAAAEMVKAGSPHIDGVLPVGRAWNRAMAQGVADPNPYDGIAPGMVSLWARDHYHGSTYGYYLEALVVFAQVTGTDPQSLGAGEQAARELGIPATVATSLQKVACTEVHGAPACRQARPGESKAARYRKGRMRLAEPAP